MLKSKEIYQELVRMYPLVKCELNYRNIYELIISVVLSAQTTDALVNKVTPELFNKYPDFQRLAKANIDDVKSLIKMIGLANTKAKNIIALSNKVVDEKQGILPSDFEYLITLPGVGRKTANVVLNEGFNIPRIAVDTHVFRVANRLNFVQTEDVRVVEDKLMELFEETLWHDLHLRLLFFGRYFCKAKKPNCEKCPFINICQYQTKNTLKA